jgi:hypothetical protein
LLCFDILRKQAFVRDIVRFDIEGHEERTFAPYLAAVIGTSAKSGLALELAGLGFFPVNSKLGELVSITAFAGGSDTYVPLRRSLWRKNSQVLDQLIGPSSFNTFFATKSNKQNPAICVAGQNTSVFTVQ